MNQCTYWKSEEIEKLRLYFLQGLSIKIMARTLDRTPGSVNKALSRFHIRTPRCFKERKLSSRTGRRADVEKDLGMPSSWTSFFNILQWLREQNIIIHETASGRLYLNKRPLSKMQLVMFANKRRIEQGHEIFLAEDVTW